MQYDFYIRHPVRQDIQVNDLVTIHYFEYGKDYQYPGESHDFWEIMYADRGSIAVRCGETEHHLTRGDIRKCQLAAELFLQHR